MRDNINSSLVLRWDLIFDVAPDWTQSNNHNFINEVKTNKLKILLYLQPRHETYRKSGGNAPRILKFGTR
jgi:hypothetical protein